MSEFEKQSDTSENEKLIVIMGIPFSISVIIIYALGFLKIIPIN